MSTFQVTAYLETPIALGRTYLTLDAVLFGILSDMRERGSSTLDPIEGVPLDQRKGMFLATRAFFLNPVESQEVKIGGVRPVRDMADGTALLKTSRKRLSKVITTSGPTKAHLSRYRTIACEGVVWIARGNPERTAQLLERAENIGALRKDGHGQVSAVEYIELDDENFLVDENGQVTRPIPVSVADDLFLQTASDTSIETWRPAYWDEANKAECYVPRED